MAAKYWLLKAEPESRIVKGKDVKFSVDDFEKIGTSSWEGVRNYEARNLMKEMKAGEKALFYHSNCKNPGIAAFAEVATEAYPDHTAWDPSHPYYDAKTDKASPKWEMVDLRFVRRTAHFVPLALLKYIADIGDVARVPESIAYVGVNGVRALKSMDLVTRGRLSVQRVEEGAWTAIEQLAEKGGWDDIELKPTKGHKQASKTGGATKMATRARKPAPKRKKPTYDEDGLSGSEFEGSSREDGNDSDSDDEYKGSGSRNSVSKARSKKRKGGGDDDDADYSASTRKRRR